MCHYLCSKCSILYIMIGALNNLSKLVVFRIFLISGIKLFVGMITNTVYACGPVFMIRISPKWLMRPTATSHLGIVSKICL